MKAGNFNINEYLDKLYENAETGNLSAANKEGLIIPDENKKSYDWLKREYDKSKTEVKVEISGAGASFKPVYDLQASTDSVKDFKPGMFGEVKTADSKEEGEKKPNLDPKKDAKSFTKGEGDEQKKELPKTNAPDGDIKDKKEEKPEEKEEKEEKEEEKPEVKKIDLKTKKNDKE